MINFLQNATNAEVWHLNKKVDVLMTLNNDRASKVTEKGYNGEKFIKD